MVAASEMTHLTSFLGQKMQLGYVVADLDAALRFWTERLGVGPFVVIENSLERDRRFIYRGQARDIRMSIAFSYLGDVQIEFIAQSNSEPSPYTDFLSSGRQGLHHLGFWPQDYPQACEQLQRMGLAEVCTIEMQDGTKNVSYFSGPPHLGVMLEVVPLTPARTKYFGGIRALAESWDGSRPIRRYSTRAEFMASPDCKS
jgi:catechol 2,3-dioxygenase-like lactoylglutathione lyase family enzyme